jgi:threonine/homoserine/homoserine lactone efflux protein
MIDASVLPLFLSAIFFLAISPGPDLVLISSYASTKGLMSGVSISLGVLLAGLIQTCLVAFGLGELMMLMPSIALTIKLLGVLYLGYLGMKMLKTWYFSLQQKKDRASNKRTFESAFNQKPLTHKNLLSKGLLNNLLNPKALLFFSLFLPQFTVSGEALTSQILFLGLILSFFVFGINLMFSLAFSQLGKRVGQRLKLGQHLDGILGVIFVGLATKLAITKN